MKDAAELTRLDRKIEKVRCAMQVPNISPFAKTRLAGRLDELIELRSELTAPAPSSHAVPKDDALIIRSKPSAALIAAENPGPTLKMESTMSNMPLTEKQRLSAILCAPDAEKCPSFARHLAFETDLSVEQVLKVLAISAKSAGAATAATPAAFLGRMGIAPAAPTAAPIVQPAGVSWDEIIADLNADMKAANPFFMSPTTH